MGNENAAAKRTTYLLLFTGMLPLLIILAMSLHNPESSVLSRIAVMTDNIPAFTSLHNPLMTKVMDVYCKTAPLMALIMFATTVKHTKINTKKINDWATAIRITVGSILFYTFFVYVFTFHNFELTSMRRPVKNMASNDILLFIIYASVYFLFFFTTYGVLLSSVILKNFIKERRK
ncbi:colicin immunity protein Cui [Escherichia coli]|uniref:colicin immunity protein Cui n=1 Tax=Escherichia coli TaxID=562 RepID=UPI00149337B2|nr:colicin immunity protein Cui [Escherichia coli]EIZ6999153.1 colicin immunity protein Cui [Shigella boydii]EIZ7000238.1 colicin immunity protein Cui [Shigella boydii]MEC6614732.1 colicin immunity protein Cui [Escherichia coli]NPI77049.1 colicin immunity protein Cui [Escherichia coli]NPI77052.1 colicin immunity protein Cui [Escherichia coli]